MTSAVKFPIVVLISGNGSNLQAMIDATQAGAAFEIRAVISNDANAYGLKRAQAANIPTHTIAQQDYASREEFEKALQAKIDTYQPELIVLAGFMRRLGAAFVQHYPWKIINIHPSLLPKYPGLHTHRRVLEAGDLEHGVTIHFVNEELDAGPILYQTKIAVGASDTEATLQQRIQAIEHQIYPQILQAFAENKIQAGPIGANKKQV
jgi:phosphoribosylglycinamide formyltransferase-1